MSNNDMRAHDGWRSPWLKLSCALIVFISLFALIHKHVPQDPQDDDLKKPVNHVDAEGITSAKKNVSAEITSVKLNVSFETTSYDSRVRARVELEAKHAEARANCAQYAGGYCLRDRPFGYPGGFDAGLVRPLSNLLCDEDDGCASLNEFNAGAGHFGEALTRIDSRITWRGFDAAGDVEAFSDGLVDWADLSLPLDDLPKATWVLCLSVYHHHPEEEEHTIVRNLHAHNCEGIILSWARPGQQMNKHQSRDVARTFESLGYEVDDDATAQFRQAATLRWLKTNLLVLRRRKKADCRPTYNTRSSSTAPDTTQRLDDSFFYARRSGLLLEVNESSTKRCPSFEDLYSKPAEDLMASSRGYLARFLPQLTTVEAMSGNMHHNRENCERFRNLSSATRAVLFPAPAQRLFSWHEESCGPSVSMVTKSRLIVASEAMYKEEDPEDGLFRLMCPVLDPRVAWTLAMPHPSKIHPTSDEDAACFLSRVKKTKRVYVASIYAHPHHKLGTVDPLREALGRECSAMNASCRNLNNATMTHGGHPNMSVLFDVFQSSEFCLQPRGDTPMRASVFDSLAVLCIPVFFADCARPDLVYEIGHHPFLPRYSRTRFGVGSWAVLLNGVAARNEPGYLQKSLEAISNATRACLRRNIARVWPRIIYPGTGANLTPPTAPDIYLHYLSWHGLAPPAVFSRLKPGTLSHRALKLESCDRHTYTT